MVDTALLNWTLQQFLKMVVILTRVGPLIFFMPVTGSQGVPVQVKILFSLMTALMLVPVIDISPDVMPGNAIDYGIFVVSEIIFAAILSVFARLILAAVQLAGQYISISMGMGMAATLDPQFGTQVSLIGIFLNLIAILIFLGLNGHHIFISTLVESFKLVHPGTLNLTQATFDGVMQGVTQMFILGVKVMAPAGVALFFSHVSMGILAKTVPQIPILIVALPLHIAIGLIFVGLSLGYFLPLMIGRFDMLGRLMLKLTAGMG